MKRVVIMSQDDYDEVMDLINRAIRDTNTRSCKREDVTKTLVKAREILWNDD